MREYTGLTDVTGRALAVAFVPGSPPRLAAATDMAAYVWPADGSDPQALAWDHTASGRPTLSVSADGRWLLAGPVGRPCLWDLSTDPPGPPAVLDLLWLVGAWFIGDGDRLLVVHKAEVQSEFRVLADIRSPVVPLAAGDARPLAFTAERESALKEIDPSSPWHTITLSADGSRLALSPRVKAVHAWDVRAGQPLGTVSLRGIPCALAYSPDGSRLAIDAGTTIYIHDGTTLELRCKWKVRYTQWPGLAWSPDGRRLARTDQGTTVRLFDAASGRQEVALGRGVELASAAFSPDGLTLATGTYAGPVRVWDMEG
jgi:WD40 repeat protein